MNLSEFKIQLINLKSDNINGAIFLENALCNLLENASHSLCRRDLEKLIKAAGTWSTVMANITNLIRFISSSKYKDPNDLIDAILAYNNRVKQSRAKAVYHAAMIIKKYKSIVTISSSSMVYESIRLATAKNWHGKVIIAESRPNYEGRNLAERIKTLPIDITFGTDSQVFSIARQAGAALIGADLYTHKYFINKTGTSALINSLAKNRAVYIVTDKSKYIAKPAKITISNMPPKEVWDNSSRKIKIVNQYFEKIEYTDSCKIVDETGLCKAYNI